VKTKRLGPPTEALGYSRHPARISKRNIVARTTIKAPAPAGVGIITLTDTKGLPGWLQVCSAALPMACSGPNGDVALSQRAVL
jgi:hypothetical protein